jgi:hypothetical protein
MAGGKGPGLDDVKGSQHAEAALVIVGRITEGQDFNLHYSSDLGAWVVSPQVEIITLS